MYKLDPSENRIFAGSSNPELANAIATELGLQLSETHISRFSNDNLYIQLGDSVRWRNVYIVQSLSPPVNDHLVELLMMIDIAKSAAASTIHVLIPYYSFARSDKKDAPRISITARLIADLLKTAGATHVMTMQLHSPQVHGFFSVPADPLTARFVFENYFLESDLNDTVVVSPDVGGAKSAARFAKGLNLEVISGNKERVSDTEVRISGLVGKTVQGFKRAIVYDDEIATGSSIVEISQVLVESGIQEISVVCTHGVFVRNALDRLQAIDAIKEVVTTDTVEIDGDKIRPKLRVLSVAPVFAQAIDTNHNRQSLGRLFEFGKKGG
ncbi:MAG: ribose-phosphate diphosphokinase [Candidatus Promineifilaceae bacterium]